mmetsp:Transcript_13121/g.39077  ORF Transcript_13121/g.39077 Transcript_13121/m.39077 type:complete len:241 (-) Transcript_13121:665-1387(-)
MPSGAPPESAPPVALASLVKTPSSQARLIQSFRPASFLADAGAAASACTGEAPPPSFSESERDGERQRPLKQRFTSSRRFLRRLRSWSTDAVRSRALMSHCCDAAPSKPSLSRSSTSVVLSRSPMDSKALKLTLRTSAPTRGGDMSPMESGSERSSSRDAMGLIDATSSLLAPRGGDGTARQRLAMASMTARMPSSASLLSTFMLLVRIGGTRGGEPSSAGAAPTAPPVPSSICRGFAAA